MTREDELHIINVLRQGSITWRGRSECLERFRTKVFSKKAKNGNSVFKYYWQCQACFEYFRDVNDLEVDHIEEVGPFKGDWDDFVRRVYCADENLTALCIVCHMKKTQKFQSARDKYVRKPKKE